MWRILLLSIYFASLKFIVAANIHYGQVAGQLNNSPLLSHSLLPSQDLSRNFNDKMFQVPLISPETSSDKCPSLETLQSILLLLKRLLHQDDNFYYLQPEKRMQILQSLKEYLENSNSYVAIDNELKFKEIMNRIDKITLVNDALSRNINNKNDKNHIQANFIFKYEVPNISNVGCKDALATLIQSVRHAQLQMINYCNQSGKCRLNLVPDLHNMQLNGISNNFHSFLNFNQPNPTQFKLNPSNQNLLNSYNIRNSMNNINSNKQMTTEEKLNEYLNSHQQSQLLNLKRNQYLTENNINSGFNKIVNDQKHNLEAYNQIYLNKEAIRSNIQHANKFNVLNHFSGLYPTHPEIQLSLRNGNLKNTGEQQIQGDLLNMDSGSNLNLGADPELYLYNNQFLINNRLHSGLGHFLSNQENNIETYNNVYLKNEASQSNIQHSDKSEVLHSLLKYPNQMPPQVQFSTEYRYPFNKEGVQNPFNDLGMLRYQKNLIQSGGNSYLNFKDPKSYSSSSQLLFDTVLNTGAFQTKNMNNRNGNLDVFNYSVLNNDNSNGYNNVPNQPLSYKDSEIFNKQRAYVAMNNQNKQNIQKQVQYAGSSIRDSENVNWSYYPWEQPKEIKYIAPGNEIKSNRQLNFDKLQNLNMEHKLNPNFYSILNVRYNPYLSSSNLHQQKGLNYNWQADTGKNNLGIHFYKPSNLLDYQKHDINGNTLFDSNRFASVHNLVKLNSEADNGRIVDLTYGLKQPQTITNPYYYVQYRMPYKDFVSKVVSLSDSPDLKFNEMNVPEQLSPYSNLAEASLNLENIQRSGMSEHILNNNGSIISGAAVNSNELNVDQDLKTIRNLNANLSMKDILTIANEKTNITNGSAALDVPGRAGQNSYGTDVYPNVGEKLVDEPQSYFDNSPLQKIANEAGEIAFLQNPGIPNVMITTIN